MDTLTNLALAVKAIRLLLDRNEDASRIMDYLEDGVEALRLGSEAVEIFAAETVEAKALVDQVLANGGATIDDLEANAARIDALTARLQERRQALTAGPISDID